MKIFPAIDLYEKKAVRLYKGRYDDMTVYSENPLDVAKTFEENGAEYLHTVDLEGARDGTTPNFEVIESFVRNTRMFVEVGGGIRSLDTVKKYLDAGVNRVILGTAAVSDTKMLEKALSLYGGKIAVGADIKDGCIAIRGWKEKSEVTCEGFFGQMQGLGVKTVICTDISRDGAMKGTNRELYRRLSSVYDVDIIASGGVSDIEDVKALKNMGLYGAIIGKAYYTGAINLREVIEAAK